MEAPLLERIMANFIGTSVWLFEKKLAWCQLDLFQRDYFKYYLVENKYFIIKGISSAFLGTRLCTCRGIKVIVLFSRSFLTQFYSIHGRISRDNVIINFIVVNALKIGNHLESVIKLPTIIILSTHFCFHVNNDEHQRAATLLSVFISNFSF